MHKHNAADVSEADKFLKLKAEAEAEAQADEFFELKAGQPVQVRLDVQDFHKPFTLELQPPEATPTAGLLLPYD